MKYTSPSDAHAQSLIIRCSKERRPIMLEKMCEELKRVGALEDEITRVRLMLQDFMDA